MPLTLGIETSCDESALALFDPQTGLVGEWVSSQVELHAGYGGVVPELAVREHLGNLPLLLSEAVARPDWSRVGRLAVTTGPGLAGCLALGVSAAKALALALGAPLRGVNHLRAHAWSVFIPVHAADPAGYLPALDGLLPHVGLLVSGGNTVLFSIDRDRRLAQLGATIDDAAGEALDKGAKLLGLGYPGGPRIEQLARDGDATAFDFPRALPNRGDLDFSFSGLKTSLRYCVAGLGETETLRRRADLCASYQAAVVDVLVRKAGFALEQAGARSLGLSGGVANNRLLRARLGELAGERGSVFLPALPQHTGDNAGMVAFADWMDPASVEPKAGDAVWPIAPALAIEAQPPSVHSNHAPVLNSR